MKKKMVLMVLMSTWAIFSIGNIYAASYLLDFEKYYAGTKVTELDDPFMSIEGYHMEVVAQSLEEGSILAFNSNAFGTNGAGGENWVIGQKSLTENPNRKSIGNLSTVTVLTGQDLKITFNSLYQVNSFKLELFDYGDWFPLQGNPTNTTIDRKAFLRAYDINDIQIGEYVHNIKYNLTQNDAFVAGAVPLTVSGNGKSIAYVKLVFEAVDPGVTFDNFTINYEPIVNINIKPYSWPNAINTCSEGATPVIIWGSEAFDVTMINLDTLTFGDKGLKVVGKGNKSLFEIDDFGYYDPSQFDSINPDLDGYDDLKAMFETHELSTFTDGDKSLGRVCFDYDVDGNKNWVNMCVEQEIFLSRDCEE
jgi:hypothetical protein